MTAGESEEDLKKVKTEEKREVRKNKLKPFSFKFGECGKISEDSPSASECTCSVAVSSTRSDSDSQAEADMS